jgi:hypothetical protein
MVHVPAALCLPVPGTGCPPATPGTLHTSRGPDGIPAATDMEQDALPAKLAVQRPNRAHSAPARKPRLPACEVPTASASSRQLVNVWLTEHQAYAAEARVLALAVVSLARLAVSMAALLTQVVHLSHGSIGGGGGGSARQIPA